jgi:NAD(P)-dependent dehydrogenase (short-subunit alcohol dehydrogenase family)
MSKTNAIYPSLHDRLVLITGGASGIGLVTVQAFHRQGARVVVMDIVDEVDCVSDHFPLFVECDVTDVQKLIDTIDCIVSKYGPIDVLVNNAACDDRHDFLTVTPDEFDQMIAVNLKHYFFVTQAVVRKCGKTLSSIINLGSMSHNPDLPVYVAAKGGIAQLTRSLAKKLGPAGTRVNCVLPGWVQTERQMAMWCTPEANERRMAAQALQGWVMPEDVAAMILFLASDDSRMCTGQMFVVDGGRY